ncbi:MAG: glycosyl hydrolase family 95 catalytic domain-containing protein [Draconibacterium sp.]
MKTRLKKILPLIILLGALFFSGISQNQYRAFTVDTESYFAKHDIVYKSPSYEGFEGFPLGNGDLGGLIWATPTGIKIQINKSDTYDGSNEESTANLRSCGQLDIDFGAPCFDWIQLKDYDSRLSLYNAETSFIAETPFSKVKVNSFVAVNENVWLIECEKQETGNYLGGASATIGLERWGSRSFGGWYGAYNRDPKFGIGDANASIEESTLLLREQFSKMGFSVACKLVGIESQGEKVSNRRVELKTKAFENGKFSILIAVATSYKNENTNTKALDLLEAAEKQGLTSLKAEHRNWWHTFWQRSFLHLPDDYIENIYYLKRYILASSSRGNYPALFNSAIFTWNHDVRNWVKPHHWNMQQIYWGILPGGDADLLKPYINTYFRLIPEAEKYALKRGAKDAILWTEPHDYFGEMLGANMSNMHNNFTPASQIASFFWDYYNYTGNLEFLQNEGYVFMKKAAGFYLQTLQWDEAKQEYFLFPCQPYEHAYRSNLRNSITDLVTIKSSFANCIAAAKILNVDKEKQKQWQHVIDHLWEPPMAPAAIFGKSEWGDRFPVGSKMHIPKDTGKLFAYAYTEDGNVYPDSTTANDGIFHFSQNTAIVFPAGLVGIEQKGTPYYEAAATAVRIRPEYRNAITPDAIVAARLGMGNEALKIINTTIRRLQLFPQGMFYNLDHWFTFSLYADSLKYPEYSAMRDYIYDSRCHYDTKGNSSGLPTKPFVQFGLEPMGTVGAALNEMMLQSAEGKIRVFPAVPKEWENRELAFKLWAEKGFEISALRNENGEVEPLNIMSKLGNTCVLVNPWGRQKVRVTSGSGKSIKTIQNQADLISFNTSAGEDYILAPVNFDFNIRPRHFSSVKNDGVKHFHEAILGKKRDY